MRLLLPLVCAVLLVLAGPAAAGAQTTGAPVNEAPPTVTGTAIDGATLTAVPGTWSGSPTFAVRWWRCDAAGANCARRTTGTTYKLAAADVDRTLKAVVTATNAGGSATATTAPSAVVAPAPPVATAAPAVTGTLRDGSTVTAAVGTWSGTPTIAHAVQWQRCAPDCADIAGATGPTLRLEPTDVGAGVRAVVTATNRAGTARAVSPVRAPVGAAPLAVVTPPALSGEPVEGGVLTAAPGAWTGTAPVTFAYQWERCDAAGASCLDLPGQDEPTRTLTALDVTATLRVVVTATNAAGAQVAASAVSAPVAAAPRAPEAPIVAPVAPGVVAPPAGTPAAPATCLRVTPPARPASARVGSAGLFTLRVGPVRTATRTATTRVTAASPLAVRLTGVTRRLRSVRWALDGRALRTRAGRPPVLGPTALRAGRTHRLTATLTSARGTVRRLTVAVRPASCG